ncbi:ATP-binding protein [Hyalangium rubrum]|uniref:histidine kinase n=1 Tax=Hyalangium rubrum TaxID=3103134 RepID=A0ABU5H121_9BACT|nr:ATP-binding protein [Hyalangium sp. s54d21]MDY7227100.1 ATP-binding protein [Hyalangium sp. s54d21]
MGFDEGARPHSLEGEGSSLMLAPRPWNEEARLEALRSYEVLDTEPEASLDGITRLAAQLCGTPIALISLLDEDRQWFKSRVGLEAQETSRDVAFCAYAILREGLFVVPDAHLDARFARNPLVTGAPHIRFYAGAPLLTPEGLALGTVCVIDRVPRQLSPEQVRSLETLAEQVVAQLELRRMNHTQRRLIDELRGSNERFQILQRATNDVVWDWDLVTNQVKWSERLAPAFGYAQKDTSPESSWWFSRLHPEDRERVTKSLDHIIDGSGTLWTDEYRFRRANGTYARVMDRGAVLRNAQGNPVRMLGAMVDVSEREEMRSRLALADRMASVGTLAAGVAHEINNPLAYVIANLDYARQEVEHAVAQGTLEAGELPDALKEAREGSERMRLIVKDLKMFSRPDDERMELVDVRRAIDSATTMAWNEIRHRARLVKAYQPVPSVYANEARLGQVFLNLLVNAAQAIPEGSADCNEIRVSTRLDERGRIVIEVRDTGGGIPEEIRARILEPFFTTKPQGMGTGLGLSICHGIIASLGGELGFDSELGKGTTFRVVLEPPVEMGRGKVVERHVLPAGRRGHILVVDDEPMVLNAIKRTLSTEHEVTVFNRARAALKWLEQGQPWDLILCDLMMPEMTGMEFHAELVRRWPERVSDIIFVTGGAFTAGAREFLGKVASTRLEKPFEPQALRELVKSRLSQAD